MPNLTGQSIGRYHILEQLGEGGMATVYKAYDTRLERDVAVKMLRTDQFIPAQLDMVLQRFEREAKALAKLKHPNIVNILDFGEHEGRPYLVMEYLPGGTLKQKLGHAVPWQGAFQVLLPIARGLAYAHQHNLIHRDVKPANILVDENEEPILTDFGIAKLLEGAEGHTLTGTGVGLGTPEYMAPEQGMGASAIDARADIYSLGIVLYEMVTGRKPYVADTPMAVVLKQMTDPLPRPTDFVPGLPESVEKILFKALAKQPEDRYMDMNALIAAMEGLLASPQQVEASTAPVPTRQVEKKAAPRAKPSRKAVTAVIGTLGAVGLIVLGIMLAPGIGGYLNSASTSTSIPTRTSPPPSTTTSTSPSTIAEVAAYECTDAIGCVEIAPGEPIHLAYALVTSGPNETLGIDSRTGIEVAIALKGQVMGHDVQLTGEDDNCSPEGGQAAGAKLAADPTIVAVIGTSCSSAARVAVPLMSQAGFVIISPSNTAPDLTEAGNSNNHPGYLRTVHNDRVQGAVAARFAFEEMGVEKAATIHDGSLYADALQAVFAETFKAMGGTITTQEAVDPNAADFKSVLTSIAAGEPEFVYYPIFVKAGSLITRQAREVPGLEDAFLMGADGMFSPDVVEGTGEAVEGLYVSSPDLEAFNEDYQSVFLPKYKELAGAEPISIFHAHAYDAANMVFAALEKVTVQDMDGTLHIPRQALRDAMYATKDFTGLTGNLTCLPTGDCADPKIAVYEYHVGEYPPERIWP
jgi:branched-chain amino acid transport system substrate-binding protein